MAKVDQKDKASDPTFAFFTQHKDTLNNVTDLLKNTEYGDAVGEISKLAMQLVSVKGTPNDILKDTVAKLRKAIDAAKTKAEKAEAK